MGTITANSRIHYFVLALWPSVLTFSILRIDILGGLRTPGRVSIEHAILSVPRIGVLYELRICWPHAWTICRAYGLAHGSFYELFLWVMSASFSCEQCLWALLTSLVCKFSLRAIYAGSSCKLCLRAPLLNYVYKLSIFKWSPFGL